MANEKPKRKYFRKCGWCGCRFEQSRMLRTDVSPNGWLCWDCIYDREQPDVVPVVRCLVCRHYDEPYCMLCKEKIGTNYRSQDMAYRKPNDFCSYGEHKKRRCKMKILKPGKLETRKFECKRCGCAFVANAKDPDDSNRLRCPTCEVNLSWVNGEFYEEPKRDIRDDREALYGILLTAKSQSAGDLADYLITNGVTFRED